MSSEIKPAAFKQGVPKEQRNGIYGIEQELIDAPADPVIAVVVFEVDDVINKELTEERYPILAIRHIEPIRDAESIEAVKLLQEAAYKKRTGANALSFDFDAKPEAKDADQ